MSGFFFLGGFLLAWVYAASTVPATIWVVQVTYSRGWKAGLGVLGSLTFALGIWALPVIFLLFNFPDFWQKLDTAGRLVGSTLCVWWAFQVKASPRIDKLLLKQDRGSIFGLCRRTILRAFRMPWRFGVWAVIFFSVGIHLRGPGLFPAALSGLGVFLGLTTWFFYFWVLAALFGRRVPVSISLHSLNKLRLLAFAVFIGLAVLLMAPLLILGGV